MNVSIPQISVVSPVYNEQEIVREFIDRLITQLNEISDSYEIILVNDGSTDGSSKIINELCSQHPTITCLELTRNFGHQYAISAGLSYAQGNHVIIMDSDLQDPPEELPAFISKASEGFDVVYGIRRTRKENFIKKLCYNTFYRVLRLLSSIEIPLDAGDFCILSRSATDKIVALPERNRFVRGLRSWIGLRQTGIEYDRDARYLGKPKYTIRSLVKLALDGLFAFSYRPLRAISLIGVIISVASFTLALFYIFQQVKFGLSPPGFASIMVAIFFFAGVQLITLGVMGEYLARIYEEVKQRPLYLVKRIINDQTDDQ